MRKYNTTEINSFGHDALLSQYKTYLGSTFTELESFSSVRQIAGSQDGPAVAASRTIFT